MKIHYLQHVPFENLGSLAPSFEKKGHQLSSTRLYSNETFPAIDDVDWVVIMGGPMGIFDEDQYPWLAPEKHFIKGAIDANKTVIGICLGAQLLAHVLGARVYPNEHKEIGWFDVIPSDDVKKTPLATVFNQPITAFHWHGDTFDIPDGAHLIGSTAACKNQGFVFEDKIVGLQFHLESTGESISSLVTHCSNELDNSQFVQSADILQGGSHRCPKLNETALALITALGA